MLHTDNPMEFFFKLHKCSFSVQFSKAIMQYIKIYCGVRVIVRLGVCFVVGASGACWASAWLSRGFRRLVALAPVASSWPVLSWTASVEPALFGSPQLSLLQELSTAVIRVHCRAAISQSFRRSSVVMSIPPPLSLSLPVPLSGNPAFPSQRVPSGLPEPMTQFEQQGSSFALTRLLAMTADDNAHFVIPHTLTRSFDNHRFKSRLSRPSANCLLSAGAAHLTLAVRGGHHTFYLYPAHKSDFKSRIPASLHRYTGARFDSKSGSLCLQIFMILVGVNLYFMAVCSRKLLT